jgi:hypothetical protein
MRTILLPAHAAYAFKEASEFSAKYTHEAMRFNRHQLTCMFATRIARVDFHVTVRALLTVQYIGHDRLKVEEAGIDLQRYLFDRR